ncbi:MAG: hypothetical protein WCL49_01710 [bacterium]
MKINKKAKMLGLLSAAALSLGMQQAGAAVVTVSSDISANTTWASTNEYRLDRLIFVKNGATLTIQPGTVVRGLPIGPVPQQPGTLLISRGAKINAQGTAANPIVFTDQYDNNVGANPGSVVNGNDYGALNNQLTGQWGGLILAGKSYIAWDGMDSVGVYTPDGTVATAIEGLSSTSDINYGGNNDLDNSGVLNYVSVRYGGYILGSSKEINGITFCGVGRGTTLDHLDVYSTKDDNVEFFGGTVGMKHLIAWGGNDDGIDTDTGWRGKIQFAMVVQGYNTLVGPSPQAPDSGDKGLEWDGAGDSTGFNDDPQSCGTMFNFTLVGMGSNSMDQANTAFNLRDNAGGRLYNGLVLDFGGGCTLIEGNTNSWPLGANCTAMKMFQDYAQDSYFTSGTNKQGVALTYKPANINYIGYPDAIAGSKKVEFKKIAFWNMGIPHSIGMNAGFDTTAGKLLVGSDNSRFSTHEHFGFYPDNTGYDIVAAGNAGGNTVEAALPIQYYERDAVAATFQPTFRSGAHPYTNVKLIDPRVTTNLMTKGIMPPADGFFTPVNFLGAMGAKNWAGPWSTAWRLGGFVTNGVPTGDDTGIVAKITKTGSGATGKVNISLANDSYLGTEADYWLVAVKNSNGAMYRYNLTTSRWVSGLVTTYQGPLIDIGVTPMGVTGLPTGTYTVYFGVDLVKDNVLQLDSLSVASVVYTR